MRGLLVLYDSGCSFCAACRRWLEAREAIVPLSFLCCRSAHARERYGAIDGLGSELVVVDDQGRFWVGAHAFLITFWALASFRAIAELAAAEAIEPITCEFFRFVTRERGWLGESVGAPCAGGHCAVPPVRAPYR